MLPQQQAVTHYGQPVKDFVLRDLMQRLETTSAYRERRKAVTAWNASHRILKRGLALTPVMFGVAFGFTPHNQGMALVSLLKDGTLTVQHGGTEMGQGLHTKMLQVAADSLGVPLASLRIMATRTDKIPNTSATAASSGSAGPNRTRSWCGCRTRRPSRGSDRCRPRRPRAARAAASFPAAGGLGPAALPAVPAGQGRSPFVTRSALRRRAPASWS